MTNLRSNLRWFPLLNWTDEKIIAVWRWNIKAFSHDVRFSCTGLALVLRYLSIQVLGGSCSSLMRKMRTRTKMFNIIWICVTGRSKMGGQWCWGAQGPLEENVPYSFLFSSSFSCLLSELTYSWGSIGFLLLHPVSLAFLPHSFSSHTHSVEYDVIVTSHQTHEWCVLEWVCRWHHTGSAKVRGGK